MATRAIFKKRRWDRDDATPSNSNSRAASQSRTPMRNDSDSDFEEDAEADFRNIQELLSQKLANLQHATDETFKETELNKEDRISARDRRQYNADSLNKARIQNTATINEIIGSLGHSRADVSSSSRELMLVQLYKLTVGKPLVVQNDETVATPNFVDEDKVQRVINLFVSGNYRTATEFLYLWRSLVALLASNIEDFSALVSTEFLDQVKTLISEPATSVVTNDNKANLITGFVTLTLVIHHGSSNFGVEDSVAWLFDLAEGYAASAYALKKKVESGERDHSTIFDKSEDKRLVNEAYGQVDSESAVAVAALHGVGCLLTLLSRGDFLNELVEDLMMKIVPLVDNDDIRDIARASARVVAVIYEVYSYPIPEEDEENDDEYNANAPYYEQGVLFAILERLANLPSKKVSKKEKKETHSVFRNILSTLQTYVDPKKREAVYKKTAQGVELINTMMDSTYIRLSKFKSLPINSWMLYTRLRNLKWCFSFGLHDQLVSNESIRDILSEPDNEYSAGYTVADEFEVDETLLGQKAYAEFVNDYMDSKHSVDEKKRSEKIKKQRQVKLEEQLDNLNIKD
ncbi:uncharacterized protein RJT20DRAFT_95651 [Scheffersomyces xylosifermentans]|uniref:uncharacterized protein n=1 Tax=Scheffersomyces xylosifermentans TaxID=1304137 RepID=UPI00315CE1AF